MATARGDELVQKVAVFPPATQPPTSVASYTLIAIYPINMISNQQCGPIAFINLGHAGSLPSKTCSGLVVESFGMGDLCFSSEAYDFSHNLATLK